MAAPSSSEIVSALLYPSNWWSGTTVTYSIPGPQSQWPGYGPDGEPSDAHYASLNAAQSLRFAAAVNTLDQVLNLSLVQVSDQGQIRVGFTDVADFKFAGFWGYTTPAPGGGSAGSDRNGDIWIDYGKAASSFAPNSYDFMAMIHELGHALGLKHPFEDGSALPKDYDNYRYTVMSYTAYTDNVWRTVEPTATGVRTVVEAIYPTTPMVFDIAALQSRYGADPATAAGNSTYTFSQSTPFMQALYDSGGVDTIDLSAHTRGSMVDLTPGAYSSIAYYSASAQAAYWTNQYGWAATFMSQQFNQASTYTWSNNLGIAFGTVIENVAGSAGADTVTGNDAANSLSGAIGDDSLSGLAGDDVLRGGDGGDTLLGGDGFDDLNGNTGDDTASGGAGSDWVVGGQNNDRLAGDDGDDIVYGNLGNDTCDGGVGNDLIRGGQGDDSLSGGTGSDWLSGDRGADTISGGAGADTFHSAAGAGLDRVLDFRLGEGDRVQLDPGVIFSVVQQGADTVVDLGAGDQLVLVGVSMTSLTGAWIS